MVEGGTIKAPASYAFLHDPAGKYWPSCSALIAPLDRRYDEEVSHGPGQQYFGHKPLAGETPDIGKLPSFKAISKWKYLGEIEEIYYTRMRPRGLPNYAKDRYKHPIENGRALLYRRGRMLRIELGSGCVWNWRGIIKP
jgi:hypothetical protein